MTACRRGWVVLALAAMLAACQSPIRHRGDTVRQPSFSLAQLAKGDVDVVAEIHLRDTFKYLRALTEKLYRRNPREWRKGGNRSLEGAMTRLFGQFGDSWGPALSGRSAIDSMRRAFDPAYRGDRVYAFVAGMGGMILQSYNGKRQFFVLDELKPQSLYNAARNMEVAAWRLAHRRDARGRPLLVSNTMQGPVANLSFERLFGKMIALQDSMAEIVADATNRRIRTLIWNVASMVFLPI